jgi:phosphatidylglycerol:prolipoprotein diacylglycerol transferase
MMPVLFRVGDFQVHAYGVMIVVAVILAGFAVYRLLGRLDLDRRLASELTLAAVAGGLVGARLYWLIEHWPEARGDLIRFALSGSGFTWYGGLLGGTLAVVALSRRRRLPLGTAANIVGPAVALGYAVGRVACQLAGDGTYGRPSDLPWAMAYPDGAVPTTVRVQPTPVYESLAMLLVFVVLYKMASRRQPGWYVFGWFLLLSGAERFAVEFVRINAFSWLMGLTPPQWFALVSMSVGGVVICATHVRRSPQLRGAAA